MNDSQHAGEDIQDIINLDGFSEKTKSDLLKKIKELSSYKPKIALFGKTGAGKSSLGNAIFGKPLFAVGTVEPETRTPNPIMANIFGMGVDLIDFPGIGESPERDVEYKALYKDYIKQIDIVLWVVAVSDRALAPDLDYFQEVLLNSGFPMNRVIIVVSHAEVVNPINEWKEKYGEPGQTQKKNIVAKIAYLSTQFSIPIDQIVAVSANRKYNLPNLAKSIITHCPQEAVLNIARAFEKEVKTEEIKATVTQRILNALGQFYKDNKEEIANVVFNIISLFISGIRKK